MKRMKRNVNLGLPGMTIKPSRNDESGKEAATRILHRFLQEAFDIEHGVLEKTSKAIDIDKIGHMYSALSNIKQHLMKVLALNSLSQIPHEDILRLQKLCGERLTAARFIKFDLEDGSGREHQAMVSECGLLSGHICLLIKSGSCQDIHLCFGNVFQFVSDALKNVLETCIIPTLLPANQLQCFTTTAPFVALISAFERILALLASLVRVIKFSETEADTLVSTALLLLFADHGTEKTGLKKLRVAALDLLVQIFYYYVSQRPSILNEILVSLKKTKASQKSRDFKLHNGGGIRLVSALIMRIIQSAGSKYDDSNSYVGNTSELALEADRLKALKPEATHPSLEKRTKKGKSMNIRELSAFVTPLLETATTIAMQIVGFVIDRALDPTETRDESFRNSLYIFVEDFIRSFDCPEWPAAEILLRLTLFKMTRLLESDETTSTVKLMAVDILGLIGAAIARLRFNIRHIANSEDCNPDFSWYPRNITEGSLQLEPQLQDITSLEGPLHASIEFLTLQSAQEPQNQGAVGYLTAKWVFATYKSSGISTDHQNSKQERSALAATLQKMIAEDVYEPKAFDPHCLNASSARLAYGLTLLRSQLCESFNRVLEIIVNFAKNLHASIRCGSIKALLQILEADPFLIGRTPADIVGTISGRIHDSSVPVRVSSLRCVEVAKEFGVEMLPDILRRVTDDSITVRKHAIKILRNIYLQSPEARAGSKIVEAVLSRTADLDETARKLACQSIADIWILPHLPPSTKNLSSKTTLVTINHLCLMARTVQGDCRLSSILTTTLRTILVHPSNGPPALKVYSFFVSMMFNMLDSSIAKGDTVVDAATTFHLLLIFAKTKASIFTKQQIRLLQRYVGKTGREDDMMVYRCVISIIYRILPLVSDVDPALLRSMSTDLLEQIIHFKRAILNEVIPCLRAIGEKLEDNKPLTNLTLSCLEHIRNMVGFRLSGLADQKAVWKLKKLLLIAGICGRYCRFEAQLEHFQMRFTDCYSVSEFMIGTFSLFASSAQPLDVRETALDAICRVCQVRPKHLTSSVVTTLFEEVFEERKFLLETVVLKAFKDFFSVGEQHFEVSSRGTPNLDHIGGSQIDEIAAFITQKFMIGRKDVMRIALATQCNQAQLALEILSSMIRQGLLYPKECTQICIALGTSQNARIAELSLGLHQTLHKYESVIEHDLQAVDLTYEYQRDVVGNVRGATCNPYRSILHQMMEVMRNGRIRSRKRFFEGLCARIEPDVSQTCWDDAILRDEAFECAQAARLMEDDELHTRHQVESTASALSSDDIEFRRLHRPAGSTPDSNYSDVRPWATKGVRNLGIATFGKNKQRRRSAPQKRQGPRLWVRRYLADIATRSKTWNLRSAMHW
ncbi:Sister chromatid cohesion protein 2 [Pseudogymnoascus australis]